MEVRKNRMEVRKNRMEVVSFKTAMDDPSGLPYGSI